MTARLWTTVCTAAVIAALPSSVAAQGIDQAVGGYSFEEAAKEALQLPVSVGKPEGFSGIVDRINDPAFAAGVGLMLENMTHAQMEPEANASLGETVSRIKKTLRNLLP